MNTGTSAFISRDSQVKRLGGYLNTLRVYSPQKCLLLFGPLGVGKSSLISNLYRSARNLPFPVIFFQIDGKAGSESMEQFLAELARGVLSEWPELEPYVDAFSNLQLPASTNSNVELLESFIDKLDEYFFQTEQLDTRPELAEIQLLFVVEDVDQMNGVPADCFSEMLSAIFKHEAYESHCHFLFTGESRNGCVEMIQNIFKGNADVEEVLVPPFSQPETDAYLKQYAVDPTLFQRIQLETGGIPLRLVEYCKNYQPEDPKASELIEKAERLISNLTQEQQEWLKIASLMSNCDSESMALFLSDDQKKRALEWLKLNHLSCVENVGTGMHVREAERDALVALQKRESASKLEKRQKRVQQFESVKRVIPKYEHRKLLSVLAEFDCFDNIVLKHIFGEAQCNLYLNLVETKTVFFSVSESNIRLSRNTRVMMQLYNRLFPVKDLSNLQAKVKAFWKRREKELKLEIEEEHKRIENNETLREEIKGAIAAVDKQIEQSSRLLVQLDKQRKTMAVEVRRSRVGYFSIFLQALGIVALYIAILYREDYMMPILALAGLLITIGFVISLRRQGNMKVKKTNILRHSQKRNNTSKDLEKLKSEKLRLATRRDQTINSLQNSRHQIQVIELMLRQPYMR